MTCAGRLSAAPTAAAPVVKAVLSPAPILEIRRNAGLSQRGMAQAIGVSVNSICNWEKGHTRPDAHNVEKLLTMRQWISAGRPTRLAPFPRTVPGIMGESGLSKGRKDSP